MMHPYLMIGGPPLSPSVRVTVYSGKKRDVEIALLDTGANATAINARLVASLDLQRIGEHRVSGPIGPEILRPFFLLNLDFLGHRYQNHPAFLSDRPYVIIGRDILNGHRIIFDGPKFRFSIK